jgi:peptidoglycan/LPS O-acetylase OafA/YrhL
MAFLILDFINDIFSAAAFRPLGRISYSVFLCHVSMIRMTMGNARAPIYISDVSIVRTLYNPYIEIESWL